MKVSIITTRLHTYREMFKGEYGKGISFKISKREYDSYQKCVSRFHKWLDKLKELEFTYNTINNISICDTCKNELPTCVSTPIFGCDVVGGVKTQDNVVGCSEWRSK